MDKQETIKILSVLNTAYPNMNKNTTSEDSMMSVMLWQNRFADYPFDVVKQAVVAIIDTSKFPPTIAEVKTVIKKMMSGPQMTEMEAWNLVHRAISNSAYNSQEEFEKLPDSIKRAVGSPDVLRSWALLPLDEVNTIIQSNVMRSFRTVQKQEEEALMLPSNIQDQVKLLSQKMMIGVE